MFFCECFLDLFFWIFVSLFRSLAAGGSCRVRREGRGGGGVGGGQ
jgi:hypothetical protein